MTGRPRTHQRIVAGAATVAVAVVLVLVAPIHTAGGSLEWGVSCADAAGAQATVNIGTVVDFGDLRPAGDPGRIRATCVPVAPGANGIKMLQAAGHSVRLNDSGLLCAIDGLPAAPECGDRTPTGYRYWAYFHGTGSSWSYSTIGPGGYGAAAGTVEGWHFIEGAGNPNDAPPSRAPTNICPAAPPPTVAPTTAPPPMTTARPPVAPPAPPTPGAVTTPPSQVSTEPAPSGAPTPSSTVPGAASGSAGGAPTDEVEATGDPAGPPGSVAAGSDQAGSPGTTTVGADGVASDVTVLAAAQSGSDGSEAGAPLATILVVAVVAAVGGVAAWRFRGRSDPTAG